MLQQEGVAWWEEALLHMLLTTWHCYLSMFSLVLCINVFKHCIHNHVVVNVECKSYETLITLIVCNVNIRLYGTTIYVFLTTPPFRKGHSHLGKTPPCILLKPSCYVWWKLLSHMDLRLISYETLLERKLYNNAELHTEHWPCNDTFIFVLFVFFQ